MRGWAGGVTVEDDEEQTAPSCRQRKIIHIDSFYASVEQRDDPDLRYWRRILIGAFYRRCELAWVNGDQIGAKFVTQSQKKKQNRAALDDRSTV